ncbi:MAG: CRISPR-associated endonuclease Cas6 [Bacteroidota bacterium]
MNLLTYKISPYLLHPSGEAILEPSPTEWLRNAILMLVNRSKARLQAAGVAHDVFHNHDEVTGNTIARYPLVLYQQRGGQLFVTGINKGAEALETLLSFYERPVEIDKKSLLGFKIISRVNEDVLRIDELHTYTVTEWLPLNSLNHKTYKALESIMEKVKFLEQLLMDNLAKDFGRYFDLDLSHANVEMLDVDAFNRSCRQLTVNGRKKDFQPFTVRFSVNLMLPEFINLGNGKVYGYGLVMKTG